jgi:hypothetical protein
MRQTHPKPKPAEFTRQVLALGKSAMTPQKFPNVPPKKFPKEISVLKEVTHQPS